MSKAVETLYTCIVCGKSWSSRQALRAHMKVHPKGSVVRTSFKVRADLWKEFGKICEDHKTTACVMLGGFIAGLVRGEKFGLGSQVQQIDVRAEASNPALFEAPKEPWAWNQLVLNTFFLGTPRSRSKMEIPEETLRFYLTGRCPNCGWREVSETWSPFGDGFRSGHCKKCGAEWIINPREVHDPGQI